MKQTRKKLIEVALPLDAINKAASREKSIRHGHPSTLHLWWARRPLAACRATLFAQCVDDPSSVPEEFPDASAQERERQRLFAIIEELVKWENSKDERVIYAARREIARSVARAFGDKPPQLNQEIDEYLLEKGPEVVDPFCGGGSIPLEAQRLGLRSYGSDLNPIAVLITKALIEIPRSFSNQVPVNPASRAATARGGQWNGRGAQGLADDVLYYGRWMRDAAERLIGHLFPKASLPDGTQGTVVAWLWARTIRCPNPACGVGMPLVRSFKLSIKGRRRVQPAIQQIGPQPRVTFSITGESGDEATGTVDRRGARCCCCKTPVSFDYIRAEGKANRLSKQLMAIVADSSGGRVYLAPDPLHEHLADSAVPCNVPDTDLPEEALGFRVQNYGMTKHRHLFTNRQLLALSTFSDLVSEARNKVLKDSNGNVPYTNAVATYLAFAVSKIADRNSTIATWAPNREHARNTFTRQAISMTWDFAESNVFSDSSGNFLGGVESIHAILECLFPGPQGLASQCSADNLETKTRIVSTDPPYYDNVPYADLSDFFYVWIRNSLRSVYPDLLDTVLVPKADELIAEPFRHGGREGARQFFENGIQRVFKHIRTIGDPSFPISVYYAFKQAEVENGDEEEDIYGAEAQQVSTGWQTFLQGLIGAGWQVCGTWPVRTELSRRMRNQQSNALASSIVLACRPSSDDERTTSRRDFVSALRRELPPSLRELQRGSIAPLDLAQAAIGPGMAVYTSFARVLDANGESLRLREALALINDVLDEALTEQEGDFDPASRWALAWFEQWSFAEGQYGVAEILSKAKNTSVSGMVDAKIVASKGGKVRLLKPTELPANWDPASNLRLTAWETVHQLIRALEAGGEGAAAALVAKLGTRAEIARELAYRLYTVCERKKRAAEALSYNGLVQSWLEIARLAREAGRAQPAQADLLA